MIATSKAVSAVGAVIAALLVFGCGGGGGGGTSSSSTASGSTGTAFAANEIVYGVGSASGSTFDVDQVKPDGTGNAALFTGVSSQIVLFSEIPGLKNRFVVVADPTGSGLLGVYTSTGLSLNGLTTVVAPSYASIASLAVTSDGAHIVYTANPSSDATGATYLYVEGVGGGTPVQYGISDGSAVSPADSDTIAYVAPPGGTDIDQVFTRSLSAGPSGAVTQITTDPNVHLLPAFNRTGTQVAFWEQVGTSNSLFVESRASKTAVSLPNPNQLVPQGESFSPDGSQLAIAADANGTGELLTQSVTGASNPVAILLNSLPVGNYGVYWTDMNGRGLASSLAPSVVRKRRGLDYLLHGASR